MVEAGIITIDTATISGTLTVPDDSIALGTKTTGNYVASLVAGTGISVGAAAEGWHSNYNQYCSRPNSIFNSRIKCNYLLVVIQTLP